MSGMPLVLDLRGVRCSVVGAGQVAERKIIDLVRAGARVRVVAPHASPRIRALSRRGRLTWRRERYHRRHLTGARLAVAATSSREINRTVLRDAKRLGIFCNVSDDPGRCSMMMPAVLERGPLMIAVSTSGESPVLAQSLRDSLARRFGAEYGPYVRLLGQIRRQLRATVEDPERRTRRQRRLLRAPLLALLRAGQGAAARRAARSAAGLH